MWKRSWKVLVTSSDLIIEVVINRFLDIAGCLDADFCGQVSHNK